MTVPGVRLSLRFLRGQGTRTALTVLAMALGVGLVCALDLVSRSMQLAFEEIIDTMAGRTALEVSAGDGGLVPEETADALRSIPGVELAVPVVRATAFTVDGSGESLAVHGIDLLNEDALSMYEAHDPDEPLIDDSVRFLANPRAIVLTEAFAARRGLREGGSIDLDTPRGPRTFTILRLLEPRGIGRVYGGNLVVMDVAAAEDAFTQRGLVSHIDIVVRRDARVDAVRAAVAAKLPVGLRVVTPSQRKVDLQNVMRSFGVLLRGIGLIGLVIAYLIAFNGVSSRFERRGWQLGVLAAIGARPGVIWRVQMQEAFVLGLASVILGLAFGLVLAYLLLPVIATATALNFNLIAPDARLVPGAGSVVMAIALGIGVPLVAAWIPASRAVREGIAMTIRGRGREPIAAARIGWRVPIVLWVAVVVAIVLQSLAASAAFGLVATALVAAAIAASASPLIQVVAEIALPVLVRIGGASGRLAATGLRDHPRRVGLTTATIAVGIAGVAWLWILARSFEASVVDALGRAIRADLIVTSTNIGSGFLEAPLSADALAAVRAVPGIDAAAGWRALEWPYRGEAIGLSAYDPEYFRDTRFGVWPLDASRSSADVWAQVARGEGVVVSTSFVASFGQGVGDRFELETPTGRLDLPIVGVTVDFVSPKGTIELSRDVFATRWRDTSVTRIFTLKQAAADVGEVRRALAARLGTTFRVRILSADELLSYFVVQVRRAFSVIPIFAAVVYLVILIGLANSLATSVLDRQRELAVAQAIGLRGSLAGRVVVLESLVIGCVGLVLAAGGGLLLAAMWVRRTFTLLLGWALGVRVPGPELLFLVVTTLAVCYVASRVPARRAGTLAVAETLRYE